MIIDAQEVPKKSKIRVVAQSRESQKLHFLTPVEIGGERGDAYILWSIGAYDRTSGIHSMSGCCAVWLRGSVIKNINKQRTTAKLEAFDIPVLGRLIHCSQQKVNWGLYV